MRRIIIAEQLTEQFSIGGSKAHHLVRVLRIKPGEQLGVVDRAGTTAVVEVIEVQADTVIVRVASYDDNNCEPASRVSLVLALLKNDKLDWIVQKAVELGVSEIALFSARYSVSKPDPDSIVKKLQRLEKIAVTATEQCGRSVTPRIFFESRLEIAVQKLAGTPLIIALHEGETAQSLREYLHTSAISAVALIIGPEGGLVEAELHCVKNIVTAGLGPRVLRAETAALAALTVTLSEFGDLG